MRLFFIVFVFLAVFSVYPEIISIYSLFTSSPLPKNGSLVAVVDDKKIYKNKPVYENTSAVVSERPPRKSSQLDKKEPVFVNTAGSAVSKKTPKGKQSDSSTLLLNTGIKKHSLKYKDGEYQGASINAYYGYVQVNAVVVGGKVTDIKFLKAPSNSSNSRYISNQALPYLKREVIQAQNDNVDIVSGATYTSMAFMQSTKSALLKALN